VKFAKIGNFEDLTRTPILSCVSNVSNVCLIILISRHVLQWPPTLVTRVGKIQSIAFFSCCPCNVGKILSSSGSLHLTFSSVEMAGDWGLGSWHLFLRYYAYEYIFQHNLSVVEAFNDGSCEEISLKRDKCYLH